MNELINKLGINNVYTLIDKIHFNIDGFKIVAYKIDDDNCINDDIRYKLIFQLIIPNENNLAKFTMIAEHIDSLKLNRYHISCIDPLRPLYVMSNMTYNTYNRILKQIEKIITPLYKQQLVDNFIKNN